MILLPAAALLFLPLTAAAAPSPLEQLTGAVPALQVRSPAAVSPARLADWTVLVYVSARNDLGLEALKDLNEMEAAGSTAKVNVVAELGRKVTEPEFNPFSSVPPPQLAQADWTGSRRFLVRKDTNPLSVTSPVLAHYPDADMGDWRHLSDFIAWGKANFPARKYLLVVGGHGSGWRGVKPPPANKGISYDEVSGNHISPAELARAIKDNGGVDVYASDACLMQTIEVVYDLRGAAGLVVGSQETTPGSGYNYEALINALNGDPGDAMAGARAVFKGFSEYYGGQGTSVTMSAVRPARAAELAVLLDRFARLAAASPADLALYREKRFSLRSFDDEDARDLYQFLKLYYENSPTPAVRAAAREAIVFLAENFVARNDAVGYKSNDANGVSVYFPFYGPDYKRKYEDLSFARDTYWDELLRALAASWN